MEAGIDSFERFEFWPWVNMAPSFCSVIGSQKGYLLLEAQILTTKQYLEIDQGNLLLNPR